MFKKLRLLHPRFLRALLHSVGLKLRYGAALDIDLFKVFIHPSAEVTLTAGGVLRARGNKRIFISRGAIIRASGGRIELGEGVFLNQNCMVVSHTAIRIGRDCMLGPNVCIFDSDHRFDRPDRLFSEQGYVVAPVELGDNVWLGANVVVTRGCVMGRSVVVGANSVAKGRLEANSVYAGATLRKIRTIVDIQKG